MLRVETMFGCQIGQPPRGLLHQAHDTHVDDNPEPIRDHPGILQLLYSGKGFCDDDGVDLSDTLHLGSQILEHGSGHDTKTTELPSSDTLNTHNGERYWMDDWLKERIELMFPSALREPDSALVYITLSRSLMLIGNTVWLPIISCLIHGEIGKFNQFFDSLDTVAYTTGCATECDCY